MKLGQGIFTRSGRFLRRRRFALLSDAGERNGLEATNETTIASSLREIFQSWHFACCALGNGDMLGPEQALISGRN